MIDLGTKYKNSQITYRPHKAAFIKMELIKDILFTILRSCGKQSLQLFKILTPKIYNQFS